MGKRRRKQSRDGSSKPSSEGKKGKREKGESRRGHKRGSRQSCPEKIGSIQSLITAATLLEGEREGVGGGKGGGHSLWKELWSADNRCSVELVPCVSVSECECVCVCVCVCVQSVV